MTMSKKKTPTSEASLEFVPLAKQVGWITLAAAWLLAAISLISYHPADPPNSAIGIYNDPPLNWAGQVGATIAYETYLMLGPGAWVLMAGLLVYLFMTATRRVVRQLGIRAIGMVMMAVCISGFFALALPDASHVGAEGAGGLLALFITDHLTEQFAVAGTVIVLAAVFIFGAIFAADEVVLALPRMLMNGIDRARNLSMPQLATAGASRPTKAKSSKRVNTPAENLLSRIMSSVTLPAWFGSSSSTSRKTVKGRKGRGTTRSKSASSRRRNARDENYEIDEDAGGFAGTESFDQNNDPDSDPDSEVIDEEYEYEYDDTEAAEADASDDDAGDEYEYEYEDEAETVSASGADAANENEDLDDDGAPAAYIGSKTFDPDELRDKIRRLPINMAPSAENRPTEIVREPDLSGYQFPTLELLDPPEDVEDDDREDLVRQQAERLQAAMAEYRIKGEVVGIDSGPTITLYEVLLEPGTPAKKLERVSNDIARALKAQNVRIVPNTAGKDTVGVEVPNLKREKVRLSELMTVESEKSAKMKLPMWLGKDASGHPLTHDLAAMPHMLIAGTTGSGKSVCMNSIIMSFLFHRRPDELKLVLVDPKMVEMSMYKDIPHLMCPVVTEMGKAAAILEWAVTKMDERYELLAEVGVRDINSYNELGWEEVKERMEPATPEEEARIPKKLPYMVFVIDELADLMMTNKEVEGHIVRIAQKARAVGMHLILATQRPQANVVTGLIKGNMPCRVSFRVASKLDSRIVLDSGGAELLLGHGDMMFLDPKTSKITRCQGTLVEDIEIRRTCKHMKTLARQSFEPQLVQLKTTDAVDVDEETMQDPLFEKAVNIVLETQRGSVSLLQRRLTIGYSRASRLIEAMASSGILGSHKNAQAREVTIGAEEWEAMKAQMAADAVTGDDTTDASDEQGNLYSEVDETDNGDVPDEFGDEYRQ